MMGAPTTVDDAQLRELGIISAQTITAAWVFQV